MNLTILAKVKATLLSLGVNTTLTMSQLQTALPQCEQSIKACSHIGSMFASATAIASATKWVPFISMGPFILSGDKRQRKYSQTKTQTLSVNKAQHTSYLSSAVSVRIPSIVAIHSATNCSYSVITCWSKAASRCCLKSLLTTLSG